LNVSTFERQSNPSPRTTARRRPKRAALNIGFGIDADGFGMGGLGGSYGGASREGYAIGFVTGSMGSHDRAIGIENALRSCLGLPSLVD
jgi:hypothetical protein